MKKYLALFLALVMVVGMVACAKEEKKPEAEKAAEGKEQTAEQAPAEAEGEEGFAENLTVHENDYFSVGYDEAAGWVLPEDDINTYDGGAEVTVHLGEDSGLYVYIYVYEAEAEDFREGLDGRGYDLKTYADGGYDMAEIGGLSLLKEEGGTYYGRDEASGMNIRVELSEEDETLAGLLENIKFTLEDVGNVDAPWPWDGEPISGGSLSSAVGTFTLTADFIPMAESLTSFETFNHDIQVLGDKVYLLEEDVLREYLFDGSSLTLNKEIELDGEYEDLEAAGSQLIISGFGRPTIKHDGSSVTFSGEGPDYLAVAPDGTWGISYFTSGTDCEKYTIADGALTVAGGIPFAEIGTISTLRIDEQYIYVTGAAADDSGHVVCIYDHSGALQKRLQDTDDDFGLGSVTFVTKTANGFLALDGNMRTVVLWDAEGTCIGSADDADLFGTSYPWFCAADVQADGSIVCIMTEDRPDGSAMELIAFKLSGF